MNMSTKTTLNTNKIWEFKNKEWEQNVKYIKKILTPRTLAYFAPILDMGREQCKAVIELNDSFFSSIYFENIRTELLTFSIMRLFNNKYLPTNFPYKVESTIINNFNKYTIPILSIDNININILKAYNRDKINNNDRKYLQQRCLENNVLKGQIDLFNEEMTISKLHGVVTYNIDKDWENYEFIDLIFFDSTLKEIIVKVDLLKTLHIYDNEDIKSSKESLVNEENLRKDIEKELKELTGGFTLK